MTGLHIIRRKLPAGDRYYVYAWRGGPRIHVQDDVYPVITPKLLAKRQAEIDKQRTSLTGPTMNELIKAYEDAPEYTQLADSSKRDYNLWLTRVSERFGKVPLEVFQDRKMRGDVLAWRNQWQDQPRTADKAAGMMSTLLGFGVEHGMLQINIAAKIKQLSKTNKADEIWEDEHWEAFKATEPPDHILDALIFASLTGLRLSDLVKVRWDQVFANSIKINETQKRKGRAVIPILPELRKWMEGRKRTGTILKNSRGFQWSASGFGCVFQRQKPSGFNRTIHDLRGTFATRLIIAGLTDEQCAMVLGWTAKRIAAIRARYVDEERVIISIAEKLSR